MAATCCSQLPQASVGEANTGITYVTLETWREIYQFVVINLLPLGARASDTNSVVTIV